MNRGITKTAKKLWDWSGTFEKFFPALLFAIMFILFIIQVFFRYFLTSLVWIQDLILLCYLWIIIYGSCRAERDDENIKFATFYDSKSPRTKALCDLISGILVVTAFSISFIPSLEYIKFMFSISSFTLPIKYGFIYLPYLYLLIFFIIQYSKKIVLSVLFLTQKKVKVS